MKKTIEIEDTLQERVDGAIEDVKTELLSYLTENPYTDKLPCLSNDLDYSGAIHEIIGGSVPNRVKEIDDTYYLYGEEIDEAFDEAGIGERNDKEWPSGWKPAAIYCYIDAAVRDWWNINAENIFNEWKDARDASIKP